MIKGDIVIKFEIIEGQTPDAENVAHALLAWVDILRTASQIVEPGSQLQVGLAGVEDGSDIFKLTLDKVERYAEHLVSGARDYPLVSKAAMALGGLIGATVLAAVINSAITTDPRIPADQMAVFEQNKQLLAESVELQKKQMRFYGILQDDPAFERFVVINGFDDRTIYSIPRSEFADRSGIWSGEHDEAATVSYETRTVTWDVVLIKPVLKPEPRRWIFARDGIEFSARMDDRNFLEAIHNKTLPMQVAEGIRMRVEIKYREHFDGTAWLPVLYSHRVNRVLDPLPPSVPIPLFSNTGTP
jgi:hypothetical protein